MTRNLAHATRIIDPIFFYDTVNSELYVNNVSESFFEELTKEEKSYANMCDFYMWENLKQKVQK
jgi:hypothetical protein